MPHTHLIFFLCPSFFLPFRSNATIQQAICNTHIQIFFSLSIYTRKSTCQPLKAHTQFPRNLQNAGRKANTFDFFLPFRSKATIQQAISTHTFDFFSVCPSLLANQLVNHQKRTHSLRETYRMLSGKRTPLIFFCLLDQRQQFNRQ